MKKIFEESKIELIELISEDIITTSNGPIQGGGDEGGDETPIEPFM